MSHFKFEIHYQTPTGAGALQVEQDDMMQMLNVRINERRGMTTLAQGVMLDANDAHRLGTKLVAWAEANKLIGVELGAEPAVKLDA